ncbi:hypothetical protein AN216_08695 [Streptomyces oceani]|uniref:Sugar kinase n=2 Tax=Streptomyces oceani TaxID=1075402 RepID=A0A1E7KKI0_9ACTN|nr:hypothetical protein AN216_08695 [Streptomyces oceani]
MDDRTPTTPPGGQRPPHRPRHRIVTLLIVVLLIAVPAGFLVKAAFVSRDSGEEKQREAALSDLTWERPSKADLRIYDVPMPKSASYVAHYEANSWKTSSLHVQFRITDEKLDKFLHNVGTNGSQLRTGAWSGVSEAQAERVGWEFGKSGRSYAGLVYQESQQHPELQITVDTTAEERPRVYVVSTVRFTGP